MKVKLYIIGGDKMKKALVIGSLNMDMTVKVEKLPKLGETIFGNEFSKCQLFEPLGEFRTFP